jgi:hypothetical protein
MTDLPPGFRPFDDYLREEKARMSFVERVHFEIMWLRVRFAMLRFRRRR